MPNPPQTVEPSTLNSQSLTVPQRSYRPKGKIAWMDKTVRDRLNHLLLDGRPYRAVIEALGPDGEGLTVVDLCRYHTGPYRHWLREQHWLAQARVKEEAAAEHCRGLEATHLSQAAIQTTIFQIYEALRDVTPGELKKMLAEDPRSYARVVNSLSRLSKESLNLQKHRDAAAKATTAELKRLDPKRELSDSEDELITQRMDDFFLKPQRRRTAQGTGEAQGPSSSVKSPMEDQKSTTDY